MRNMNAVLILGILTILAVVAAFYHYVGSSRKISISGDDWGVFGDYFGGVAGTLLSFISIILLVHTVRIQIKQLANSEHEVLKRDLLAHVTKADDEIQHWLLRKLAYVGIEGETIEFGDIVWGLVSSSVVNSGEFRIAAERLLKLTCLYCGALALYRDNIDSYFIFNYHKQKAQSLVSFLKENQQLLNQMAGPSLDVCQMHLDGSSDA